MFTNTSCQVLFIKNIIIYGRLRIVIKLWFTDKKRVLDCIAIKEPQRCNESGIRTRKENKTQSTLTQYKAHQETRLKQAIRHNGYET